MLPPPPETPTFLSRLIRLFHHPLTVTLFRCALFVIKLLSLTFPCNPFATSIYLLYPLLGVAALDLGLMKFDLRRSFLLFGAHLVTVIVAGQYGRLCEDGGFRSWWEEA
jgi:hypothetical protein